ncbi:Plexin domain-containing protein 1, partial [Manacus vitellinus]
LQEDNHSYYVSRVFGPGEAQRKGLWVDMAAANGSQVKIHGILSNTHRQASRIILSFDFPFYGHLLRQVPIATGECWRLRDEMPWRAGEDRSGWWDEERPDLLWSQPPPPGTVFVVQWDKVYLQGKEDMGSFTFQAALHSSGRIVFGYKEIPVPVLQISATQHPVKAGLSDAFMVLNPSPDVPGIPQGCLGSWERGGKGGTLGAVQGASRAQFAAALGSLELCREPGVCAPGATSVKENDPCPTCFHCCFLCSSLFHEQRFETIQRSHHRGMEAGGKRAGYRRKALILLFFLPCFLLSDDTKLNQFAGAEGMGSSLPSKTAPIPTGTIVGIVLAVLLVAGIILAGIYISSHPTSNAALFFIERRPHHWPAMKFRNHTHHATYAEVEAASQEKEGFVEAEQC